MKKYFLKIISFLIDYLRPLLGSRNCCIYPISCQDYAKITLQNKNIFWAAILITLRLLSCNPITALILRIKNKYS